MKTRLVLSLLVTILIFLLYTLLLPVIDMETAKTAAAQFKDTDTSAITWAYARKSRLALDVFCALLWVANILLIFKPEKKESK